MNDPTKRGEMDQDFGSPPVPIHSPINGKEALELLHCENEGELWELLSRADMARRTTFGEQISFCAILNARSGNCPEDCAFCAQSAHNQADIHRFPLLTKEEMVEAASRAADFWASLFSIVTSGRAVNRAEELQRISAAVTAIAETLPLRTCASLGLLERGSLKVLQRAGLFRYHHNLETAQSHFARICTTRTYQDSIRTVEAAKEAGLQVCCGGIFGLGESKAQRIELLSTIKDLDIDSVPLNFLHPIPKTPLEKTKDLTPMDCLRIVAVARLMMPRKEIRVCGGREHNLRDLQALVFAAGANGLMVGGYLTTSGRSTTHDRRMVEDLGLEVAALERS